MKNLKYLILFEKFKSSKLSKTLSYIKDDQNFLKTVKKIAHAYDFPISELSDEMFDYMPFKSALKVNKEIDLTPKKCDGKSEWIEGENCTDGKVKRTWGKGFRLVNCSKCGGSGILKPKTGGDPWCIKFWFNSEGKLVTMTSVDGTISDNILTEEYPSKVNFSKYDEGDESYRPSSLLDSSLKTGDPVIMAKDGINIKGYIFRDRSRGRIYFISDDLQTSGTAPSSSNDDWKKYGNKAWSLGSSDHGYITKLIKKEEYKEEDKEDNPAVISPYRWNYRVDVDGHGRVSMNKNREVKSLLADAHFAIILYLDNFKTGEYKKNRATKSEREESRVGAAKLVSDDDIKRQNIERYIDQLVGKFDISVDISGVTKVIPRLLGTKNCLYWICAEKNTSDLNNIISNVYKFMKSSDEDKKDIIQSIQYDLRRAYKNNMQYSKDVENNKNEILKKLNDPTDLRRNDISEETSHKLKEIIIELDKLSDMIYKKILSSKTDTIEDMEIIYSRLFNIRTMMRRERYATRKLSNFIEYLFSSNSRNSWSYLSNYNIGDEYADDILHDIKIISNIVERSFNQ